MTVKEKFHLYEGMYIISARLSDDARSKALDKIVSGIEQKGGEVLKIHDQGKKRLAYEINGHREGNYYVLYFNVPPHAMKELWLEYRLSEDLIRFFTQRTEQVMETLEFKQIVE